VESAIHKALNLHSSASVDQVSTRGCLCTGEDATRLYQLCCRVDTALFCLQPSKGNNVISPPFSKFTARVVQPEHALIISDTCRMFRISTSRSFNDPTNLVTLAHMPYPLHDNESGSPPAYADIGEAGGAYDGLNRTSKYGDVGGPVDSEIARLIHSRRGLEVPVLSFRKNLPRHTRKSPVSLPTFDPSLLKHVLGTQLVVSDQEIVDWLTSNRCLPLIRSWKRICLDDSARRQAFEESARAGPCWNESVAKIVKLAKRNESWLVQSSGYDTEAYGICAQYSRKICNAAAPERLLGRDNIVGLTGAGLCVSANALLAIGVDVIEHPQGFFSILLDSVLADPMQKRVRKKWEETFAWPQHYTQAIGSPDIQPSAIVHELDVFSQDPFDDRERITFLTIVKDALPGTGSKSPRKQNMNAEWQAIAHLMPGRSSHDCFELYKEYERIIGLEVNGKIQVNGHGLRFDRDAVDDAAGNEVLDKSPGTQTVSALAMSPSLLLGPSLFQSASGRARTPDEAGFLGDERSSPTKRSRSNAYMTQPYAPVAQMIPVGSSRFERPSPIEYPSDKAELSLFVSPTIPGRTKQATIRLEGGYQASGYDVSVTGAGVSSIHQLQHLLGQVQTRKRTRKSSQKRIAS